MHTLIHFLFCQNACIGVGQELLKRGHKINFLVRSDKRTGENFSAYGFRVIELGTSEKVVKSADEAYKEELDFFKSLGIFEKLTPIDKLKKLFKVCDTLGM